MYNPDWLLPSYGKETDEKSKLFETARKNMLQALTSSSPNDDLLNEGARGFFEAFKSGVLEAGVNMLALAMSALISSVLGLVADQIDPFDPDDFHNFIESYTSALHANNHPAGAYYLAFALIYGLYRFSPSCEDDYNAGRNLMVDLAQCGNKYALNFLEYYTAYQEVTQPSKYKSENSMTSALQEPPIDVWSELISEVCR